MGKKENLEPPKAEEVNGGIENKEIYTAGATPFLYQSPYYLSCLSAFEQAGTRKSTPYIASYSADFNNQPLSYSVEEANPAFNMQVYGNDNQTEAIRPANPYLAAFCGANDNQPLPYYPGKANPVFAKIEDETKPNLEEVKKSQESPKADLSSAPEEVRYFKKRPFVMILILILSLVCLALPIVSSLALVEDFVDLEVDVLAIADVFEGDITLDTLVDNLEIILLIVVMILALVLVLKALFALITKKKCGFGLIAFITLLVVLCFAVNSNLDLIDDFAGEISKVLENYALLALIAIPLVIFILSGLTYKKINK